MSPPRCPSDLALEAYLLDREASPLASHVAGCTSCTARVQRMEADGEEFRRFVFPATVDSVEEAASRRRLLGLRWPTLLAPVGAAAAVIVAVVLAVVPRTPDDGYLGVKGSGMALAVFVDEGAGARAVEDGGAVPATAGIRFKVQPAEACWLWIMSVDAQGEISRLYPPKGTPPDRRGAGEVPGGAVLDGQAGPERIFAVCAPDEKMHWNEVKSAATVAAGGAEQVRKVHDLGAPLARALQASLLLEKRP